MITVCYRKNIHTSTKEGLLLRHRERTGVASESAGEVDGDDCAWVVLVVGCWQNLRDRAANGLVVGCCRRSLKLLPAATLEGDSGEGGGRRQWVWCQGREKRRLVDGVPLLLLVLVMASNGFLLAVQTAVTALNDSRRSFLRAQR